MIKRVDKPAEFTIKPIVVAACMVIGAIFWVVFAVTIIDWATNG